MEVTKLDPGSHLPLYMQVADVIEKKITSKEIAVGERLPSLDDLCSIFEVGHMTVRGALAELTDKGYILARQKLGTIVVNNQPKLIDLKRKNEICFVTCVDSSLGRTLEDPYFYEYIRGAEAKAGEKGLNLLNKTLDENDRELDFEGNGKNIAGLIVAGKVNSGHLRMIRKTQLPFVLIGDVYQGTKTAEKFDVVTREDFEAVYLATKHLIGLGHKRIVYFAIYFDRFSWDIEALRGYRQALADAGIACDKNLMLESGSNNIEGICSVMKSYLEKSVHSALHQDGKRLAESIPFTGLVIQVVPSLYLGAMEAFKTKNIRVPEDVSVVTIDEFPGATRVTDDAEQKGMAAAERLIERLTNPDWKPERIIIPNKLIAGYTTRQLNGERQKVISS